MATSIHPSCPPAFIKIPFDAIRSHEGVSFDISQSPTIANVTFHVYGHEDFLHAFDVFVDQPSNNRTLGSSFSCGFVPQVLLDTLGKLSIPFEVNLPAPIGAREAPSKVVPDEARLISMDKKYTTRDGKPVRLLCVDRVNSDYPVVGLVLDEITGEHLGVWTVHGHSNKETSPDLCDLVKFNPYRHLKIDDKVFVRDAEHERWFPRHFAGVCPEDGRPLAWIGGATSWSCNPIDTNAWNYCRLPGDEDL